MSEVGVEGAFGPAGRHEIADRAVNDTLGTGVLHFCPPNRSPTNLDQVPVQRFRLVYLFKSEGRSPRLYSGLHTRNPNRGQSDKDSCRTSPRGDRPANKRSPGLTGAKMESEQTCR